MESKEKTKNLPESKKKIKHILFKDIGKPIGYFILILATMLGSFGISTVFVKNPDKTPDLFITLLGGIIAGLIGFYAAKQAYKEQQGHEERGKLRNLITELQSEILQNSVHTAYIINLSPTDIREINYPFLRTSAWENVKRDYSASKILKKIRKDLYLLYIDIDMYNIRRTDFITAKNNCIKNPHNPELKGVFNQCRENLDKFLEDLNVKKLAPCLKKLRKIIKENNIL